MYKNFFIHYFLTIMQFKGFLSWIQRQSLFCSPLTSRALCSHAPSTTLRDHPSTGSGWQSLITHHSSLITHHSSLITHHSL